MRLTKRRSTNSVSSRNQSTTQLPPPPSPSPASIPTTAPNVPLPLPTALAPDDGAQPNLSPANDYPPSAFNPHSNSRPNQGWGFGRIQSFKGKARARKMQSEERDVSHSPVKAEMELGVLGRQQQQQQHRGSLGGDEKKEKLLDIPSSLHSNVTTSFPSVPSISSSHTLSISTTQPLIASTPKIPRQAPVATVVVTTETPDYCPPAPPRPPLATALSTASSSPSTGSGDSCQLLVARTDDGQPHRRPVQTPNTSKKLTKRRPVSVVYGQLEMTERRTYSHHRSTSTDQPPQLFPLFIEPVPAISLAPPGLTLPMGAAPPHHHYQTQTQPEYPLNRNPSSSTGSASSGVEASTEESALITTPFEASILPGGPDIPISDSWDAIDNPNPHPGLSRSSSTRSYLEGDDGSVIIHSVSGEHTRQAKDSSGSSDETATHAWTYTSSASRHADRAASPTHSTTTSTVTSIPTVSTGSTATARARHNLRISTSTLDLTIQAAATATSLPELDQPLPESGKRRSVAFEMTDPSAKNEPSSGPTRPRRSSRPSRPPLIRGRSSSLDATSIMTSYSIGEVVTASYGISTPARAVQLDDNRTEDQGTVAALVNGLLATGESMQRAFTADGTKDWHIDVNAEVPRARRTGRRSSDRPYSPRRAPVAPHLESPRSPALRLPRSAPPHSTHSPSGRLPPIASSDTLAAAIKQQDPSPIRPELPQRSTSLRRIWRTISSGSSFGSKSKKKQLKAERAAPLDTDRDGVYASGPPPVPQVKKNETVFGNPTALSPRTPTKRGKKLTRTGPVDPMIPLIPLPDTPHTDINKAVAALRKEDIPPSPTKSRKSKARKRPPLSPRSSSLLTNEDSVTQHHTTQLPHVGLSTGPEDVADPVPRESPVGLSHHLSQPTQKSFRNTPVSLTTSATATWRSPLGPYTPPLTALNDDHLHGIHIRTTGQQSKHSSHMHEHNHRRISLHEQAELQSHEARRKYRQTLIEITDDLVFQQVLQDLARLESDPRVRPALGGGLALRDEVAGPSDAHQVARNSSRELEYHRQRNHEMGGMFVVREMLYGERRYGRLLARGVQMVKSASESRAGIPPVPPLPGFSNDALLLAQSTNRPPSTSPNPRSPSRLRRPRTAPPEERQSPLAPHSSSTECPLPSLPTNTELSGSTSTADDIQHLSILLDRMPRLLALSLTLSSRLAHDPNPYSAAEAFLEMESDLKKEIAGWASDIGQLMSGGMGQTIGLISTISTITSTVTIAKDAKGSSSAHGPRGRAGHQRGRSMGDERYWADPDDRLSFNAILISPIQRGLRYHLQFKELATKTIAGTRTAHKVQEALEAALRLAEECNRNQKFDMEQFRRMGGGEESARKSGGAGKKGRPLTMIG